VQPAAIAGRKRHHDGFRHVVEDHKNIISLAVVALCPQLLASLAVNELRADAPAVAGSLQTALKYVAGAQFAADLLGLAGLPL
jgi:hypothetical protein